MLICIIILCCFMRNKTMMMMMMIARHGVPPINLFVIPTLGIAHSFNYTPAFVDMRLVDAFLFFFPRKLTNFREQKL